MTVAEAAGAAPSQDAHLARSTVAMTLLTAVSRATGLVRILVVGAVVGTTYLGNTYESTNTVPNILFELMAAGTFQAVLIPALVRYRDQGDQEEAEHVASSVFGLALVALFGVALLGMAASPLIARALFSGASPAVRADEVRLGTIFLLIFLPQVGMYAVGMVSTGILNAHSRFAVPAVAPAVNNVIVCTAYALFWASRSGAAPSLHLTGIQIALLAGGTTAGVVGFCAVPLIATRRTGFRLRVRFDRHHPEVRRVVRMGAWAAGFLASTQILIAVELLLGNHDKGGVIALQIGWTFFLLPYAMFAQPVLTALFPTMARQAAQRDHRGFARSIENGTELICLFTIPMSIAFVAVAPAMCRGLLFGQIKADGAAAVARVVVGFAPGVVGYGLLLFYARVLYARDDARTPTIVNLIAGIGGAVVMLATFGLMPARWKVPSLAAWHAVAYTIAAIVIVSMIRHRLPADERPHLLLRLRPQLLAAVPVGVAAVLLGRRLPIGSRTAALAGGTAVGVAVIVVYAAVTALLGGPSPQQLLRVLRGRAPT